MREPLQPSPYDRLPEDSEQALVRQFFGNKRAGFFVEVGANRPQQESQTWHLERLGWSGVLVEPQPDLAEELTRIRRACVFAVACSSRQNAGKQMRLHVAGALSALDRDRMAPGAKPERVIEVPVRALDDILAEAGAPAHFDFLSIDVEGHEIEVLSGLDLARWRPHLILLEDHVENLTKHIFLSNCGYRLIRRCGNNGWYVPRDAQLTVELGAQWQIFRKYYLALPFRMARNLSRRARQPFKDWLRDRRARRWALKSNKTFVKQSITGAAGDRVCATARLAAATSSAPPRNVWRTGRTCLQNCRAQ